MNFKVEKVSDHIYRISMIYVCCYLVVGEDNAILIDTGWGYGDLKSVVESITDLPLTVINTHGHPDHAGGNAQFDEVYISPIDMKVVFQQTNPEVRRKIMLRVATPDFDSDPYLWLPAKQAGYKPLNEGMVFDLGGVTIEPYDLPGHTRGIMVFIVPEDRIAIFGDAISHPTLMTIKSSSSIQEHYDAMVRFKKNEDKYDRVLVQHMGFELDKIVLDNNI